MLSTRRLLNCPLLQRPVMQRCRNVAPPGQFECWDAICIMCPRRTIWSESDDDCKPSCCFVRRVSMKQLLSGRRVCSQQAVVDNADACAGVTNSAALLLLLFAVAACAESAAIVDDPKLLLLLLIALSLPTLPSLLLPSRRAFQPTFSVLPLLRLCSGRISLPKC